MFRILDVLALALVALVLLMPKPGIKTKAGLDGLDDAQRARSADLERLRTARPDDVGVAAALADLYLRGHRPEWALQTLSPLEGQPDHRVGLGLAMAHADRYELAEAKRALDLASGACAKDAGCTEPERARLALFHRSFDRVVADGVRFDDDPHRARALILEGLHNARVPGPPP